MKRILIMVIIVFSVIIAGILYATHGEDEQGFQSLELAYMAQYPAPMPQVLMEPAGCLLTGLSQ